MDGETSRLKGETKTTDSQPTGENTDERTPRLKVAAYQQAITVRNVEMQLLWVRYNIQAALNIGLLVAVTGLRRESPFSIIPGAMTAGAGVFLAGLWLYTTWHSGRWLQHWEKELIHLENMIGEEEVFPLFRRAYANPPRFTFTQQYAVVSVPFLVMIIWILLWWIGLLDSSLETPLVPGSPSS